MAEDCWLQARLYLGLEHSPEQQDNESLCFSILVGHGQSHTFRVELATDLAIWEKSFQRAVFLEVQRIRVSISMYQMIFLLLKRLPVVDLVGFSEYH